MNGRVFRIDTSAKPFPCMQKFRHFRYHDYVLLKAVVRYLAKGGEYLL